MTWHPAVRPKWRRWLAPRGSDLRLVTLSMAWFVVALVAFLATEVTYGWLAAPIRHWPHAIAYLLLVGWLYSTRWLHRRRAPR